MTDLPPDLPRLRTLETWLAYTLERVRQQIVDAERREAEKQRGIEARPPAPDWLIERGLSKDNAVYVHVGGCWNTGKRSKGVDQATALRALTEAGVPACTHCRPDTALGLLD